MRTLLAAFLISLAALYTNAAPAQNIARGGVGVVVIDAGHGGPKFPGAHYRNVYEKDLNLQIALKLGKLIERELPGIEVIYTRTTDKGFSDNLSADLQARADIANKAEGDLFISIHTNAARSTAAHGVETLIMGESPKETRYNEDVLFANNREEFIDMSDEKTAAIVRAYIQNLQFTYGEYSEAMARFIQKNYGKSGRHDRGVKPQLLKVLYATDMPSVLTEIGFMSNPDELAYMTSSKGQDEIARALLGAVRDYVAYVDRLLLREEPTEQAAVAQPAPVADRAAGTGGSQPGLKRGFTVQLLSSAKPLAANDRQFKTYRGEVEEYVASGRYKYKYCFGRYADRASAEAELRRAKEEFGDAFVVRFDGKKIVKE